MSFVVNPYMFGLRNQFWTDLSSTAGKGVTGFNATFTNALTVNWGDGTTTPLTSNVSVNKTLGTTNAIELETNNAVVTQINCGTSSPRLGGTVDLSAFPNLQVFRCNSNDITAISGYASNSNLRHVEFFNNKVTGGIPTLSTLTNLGVFDCSTNNLTGSIPSLSSNVLEYFICSVNQLTGVIPSLSALPILRGFICGVNQLTGSIPSVSNNPLLLVLYCNTNSLTGSIPSLSNNGQLLHFWCYDNQLTGSIPSLSNNPNLTTFYCFNNALTGSIPDLSNNANLADFRCYGNQITGFNGGSVSNSLGIFRAESNQLTSTAVNAILAAFVAAGRTSANGTCILDLSGTGNAAPTGQGLADRQTLRDRGWRTVTGSTVITN